jgi:hypothetical protein
MTTKEEWAKKTVLPLWGTARVAFNASQFALIGQMESHKE